MKVILRLGVLAAALGSPGLAQQPPRQTVELNSAVFVERAQGNALAVEPAGDLSRGDRVILMLSWNAPHGSRESRNGFTVTSPVPRHLVFQRSASDLAEMSVDGGASWGPLDRLRISERGQERRASPEDVTHLRVRIVPRVASRGQGRITYSAIVR